MTQTELNFDVCAQRHRGNRQSVQAHNLHAPRRQSQRQRVYVFIHAAGERGATVEEISDALKVRYTTCSGRCSELKRDGMIRESGRLRDTTTGSPAAVLVVA